MHERHTMLCISIDIVVVQGPSGSTQSESMGTSTQMMDIDSMTSQVHTLDALHPVLYPPDIINHPCLNHFLFTRVPAFCMRGSPILLLITPTWTGSSSRLVCCGHALCRCIHTGVHVLYTFEECILVLYWVFASGSELFVFNVHTRWRTQMSGARLRNSMLMFSSCKPIWRDSMLPTWRL